MKDRISDLHREMLDLKKCQIDLMKIAMTLFAAISSVIVALYEHLNPIDVVKGDDMDYVTTGAMLGLFTIVPLLFPYIAWIIIHKSRSLFRLSSYIMFLEKKGIIPEAPPNIDISLYSYERLYNELCKDKWLTARFKEGGFVNFLRSFRGYSYWKRKYEKAEDTKIERSYKGGYYSRILRFIVYMAAPYWALGVGFALYYIYLSVVNLNLSLISTGVLAYTLYIIFMGLYLLNNSILLYRYNQELRDIPFSKNAQHEMWQRALDRLKRQASV